jgi:hypothetical protein
LFKGSCFSGSGFFGVLGTGAISFSTTIVPTGVPFTDAVYGLVGFLTALELPLLYIFFKDLTSLELNFKASLIL